VKLTPSHRLYGVGAILLVALTICSRNFSRMGETSFFMEAGSDARRRTMVPAVAAAVPWVDLNSADYDLDFAHYSHLLCLAFAHSRTAVVSSWLNYDAGI
jgi:hypothetical protein